MEETITYEHLQEKRPEGYSFFPLSCVDGVIRCSSLFPYGYILVLTKVKGEPLEKRWADASTERKEFIYQQVLAAINALRDVGVLWADPGPRDVLYHEDDNKPSVSVIDFESIEPIHPFSYYNTQKNVGILKGSSQECFYNVPRYSRAKPCIR